MKRGATISLFWSVAALLLLPASAALAESPITRERVRVSYDVPAGCPPQGFYEGRVGSRIQGTWLADSGSVARVMSVSVLSTDNIWVASLNFEDEVGRAVTRTVRATTCEEAVSAIALITALALEYQTLSDEDEALLAPPPKAREKRAEASLGGAQSSPPRNAAAASSPRPGKIDPTFPRSGKAAYELGLSYLFSTGIGSKDAHGGDVYFGVSPDPRVSWLRLGFSVFDSGESLTQLAHVRSRVRTVATRVQSCPLRLRATRWLSVPLCAGIEVGLLYAQGTGESPYLTTSRSDQSFWLVPSVSPRLAVQSGPIYVELGPEARLFPIQRDYQINYRGRLVTAFETPWGGLGVVATAGLHFQ